MKHIFSINLRSATIVSSIAVAGLASQAVGAPVVFRDFQFDTVGGSPSPGDSTVLLKSGGERVEVINASSTPADPFGGAGNKSLLFENSATGNYALYAMVGPSVDGVTVGTFSTQFYHTHHGDIGDPFTVINLGAFSGWGPGASSVGPQLGINGATNILVNFWGTSIVLDNFVSVNAVHTLVINFDTTTDTFTGTLDGNPLTAGGGATTTFPFLSDIPLIYAAEFQVPTSSRTGQVMVDNVTIDAIPEPTSIALIVAGGLLFRRRY